MYVMDAAVAIVESLLSKTEISKRNQLITEELIDR